MKSRFIYKRKFRKDFFVISIRKIKNTRNVCDVKKTLSILYETLCITLSKEKCIYNISLGGILGFSMIYLIITM